MLTNVQLPLDAYAELTPDGIRLSLYLGQSFDPNCVLVIPYDALLDSVQGMNVSDIDLADIANELDNLAEEIRDEIKG